MANRTFPIHVNLPDDWIEQVVNRLRNDPESEWVEIIRCKDCRHWREQELCGIWDQYISNGDFYCGCAKRKEGADG